MADRDPLLDRRLDTRMQAVSLRQLRFVVALADSASFSRAAKLAGISQPALSAAIRQVETLLELRLFDRDTHGVALTAAGVALLPHVRRLLITANNAFVQMADAALRESAIVRIGAIPSAVPAIAGVLARLAPELDRLSIHVSDGKSDVLAEQLQTGALDMIVCVQSQAESPFVSVPLAEDEMLLLVRSDHTHASAAELPWKELRGEEIVHFSGGGIGELVSAAMRQNALLPSTRYRVDQVDSLFGLVRAGLAVGVMPRLYTMGLGWGEVALVPLVRPTIRRRLVLLRRRALIEEHPEGASFAILLAEHLCEALKLHPADQA